MVGIGDRLHEKPVVTRILAHVALLRQQEDLDFLALTWLERAKARAHQVRLRFYSQHLERNIGLVLICQPQVLAGRAVVREVDEGQRLLRIALEQSHRRHVE